jgi:cbb3-type cytochrome oxidase subunit 3
MQLPALLEQVSRLNKYRTILLLLAFLIFPFFVHAFDFNGKTGLNSAAGPNGMGYNTSSTTDISTKIGSYIGIILSFIGVIFLVLAIYAGYLWMMAQGNQQEVDKAKKILTQAVIGLIIVVTSYTITSFVGNNLNTLNNP